MTQPDLTGVEKLYKLVADLKGPHDDVAMAKGVELGMSLAEQNRRDEFKLVFEAGFKAGFKAALEPSNVDTEE